jgi:ABC-2 type transport system permease protein
VSSDGSRAERSGATAGDPEPAPDGGVASETSSDGPGDAYGAAQSRTSALAWFRLFQAILYKRAILLIRYPVDTIGSFAGVYIFFVLIFYGGRAVAGPQLDDSLGGLIVGYFLATMGITAYQELADTITDEAQWGTLEQLYMSPLGFGAVMLAESIVHILVSFFWGAVILTLMLLTTGQTLTINLLTVLPLITLATLSALGFGLIFAGAAVLFKRISNVFSAMTFVLLAFTAAPVGQYPALKALPLAQGSYLLRQAMNEGVTLLDLPPVEVAILAGVAGAYLAVGYTVFALATRRARQDGVLGHY